MPDYSKILLGGPNVVMLDGGTFPIELPPDPRVPIARLPPEQLQVALLLAIQEIGRLQDQCREHEQRIQDLAESFFGAHPQ